jgi:2-dehydro-3-deoxygluconokinase
MSSEGEMSERIVTFGEIMLRMKTPGSERFTQARSFEAMYAGGEANVAISLANFGVPSEFVTRLPKNELGDACLNSIRQYGVQANHILRGGERLGVYFLEAGAAQRASKVIYDRTGSSFATIQPGMVDWDAVFKDATWFHWTGITPAVSESAARACEEAVLAAKKRHLMISTDLNYRAKLWGWTKDPGDVMSNLVQHCTIAIGNEEDTEKVFGIKARGTDIASGKVDSTKYQAVCEQLVKKMPNLNLVAITLRGSISASHNTWSGVLWSDSQFYTAPLYDILPIIDRVGGGDAFAAGLIFGLNTFAEEPHKALNFAVAASCLKHSIPGDFNLVSVAEVEALVSGEASGRVQR